MLIMVEAHGIYLEDICQHHTQLAFMNIQINTNLAHVFLYLFFFNFAHASIAVTTNNVGANEFL